MTFSLSSSSARSPASALPAPSSPRINLVGPTLALLNGIRLLLNPSARRDGGSGF